jgi:hypothetical protein
VLVLVLLALAAATGFAADQSAASGLAILAIASLPALFAVPPRGRPALGIAIAGVALLVGFAGGLGGDPLAWTSVAALVAAGCLIVWRGRTWPALGSRFGSSPSSESPDAAELWRHLDRGQDPTEMDEQPDPPRV